MADDLLLHTCCGPCATVAVPALRARGVEPIAWYRNPNIQPEAEWRRRLTALRRYSEAVELELVVADPVPGEAWRRWAEGLSALSADERCRVCLGERLREAAAEAAARGIPRFSTTLSVSPYQRHDLIVTAGEAAGEEYGVRFVYADLRGVFRESYDACRRYDLYRQPYCGCAVSKWDAWHQRRARRRSA